MVLRGNAPPDPPSDSGVPKWHTGQNLWAAGARRPQLGGGVDESVHVRGTHSQAITLRCEGKRAHGSCVVFLPCGVNKWINGP